jgi:hypothetical protein
VVDVDASMFRVRPSDPDVESLDKTYRAFHAARGNDLEGGLRLSRLLTTAGEVVAYRRAGGRRLAGLDPGPRADR